MIKNKSVKINIQLLANIFSDCRRIRGLGSSLGLSDPKTEPLLFAATHLSSPLALNAIFLVFLTINHFFLILSAVLLKNRSLFSLLQFYVLQDDHHVYSQFSRGKNCFCPIFCHISYHQKMSSHFQRPYTSTSISHYEVYVHMSTHSSVVHYQS